MCGNEVDVLNFKTLKLTKLYLESETRFLVLAFFYLFHSFYIPRKQMLRPVQLSERNPSTTAVINGTHLDTFCFFFSLKIYYNIKEVGSKLK